MSDRRKWAHRLLVGGLLILLVEQTWRHGHDYVFADRFAEVEPGRIYRGAWQKGLADAPGLSATTTSRPWWPWRTRRITTSRSRSRPWPDEMGFRWIHIPIVDNPRRPTNA